MGVRTAKWMCKHMYALKVSLSMWIASCFKFLFWKNSWVVAILVNWHKSCMQNLEYRCVSASFLKKCTIGACTLYPDSKMNVYIWIFCMHIPQYSQHSTVQHFLMQSWQKITNAQNLWMSFNEVPTQHWHHPCWAFCSCLLLLIYIYIYSTPCLWLITIFYYHCYILL